jgi:serine/threonine-protein kinase
MPKVLVVARRNLASELGATILWSAQVERVFADSLSPTTFEVARALAPSLVVVDAPDPQPAATLVRRLRESAGTRRSSIVALAAGAEPRDELQKAGANAVVWPPVDPARWDPTFEALMSVPRRMRMRFPVQVLETEQATGSGGLAGNCLDISTRGMLLQSPTPLRPSESLQLRFKLPGEEQELQVGARVVRVPPATPLHAGVKFDTSRDASIPERIGAWVAAMAPDRDFGRYEPLGIEGEGAMGRVYRAFDPLAHRVIAIKTLRPEYLDGAERDEYLARFRQEAQAAAGLVHPNIVTIFDVGEDYFAMELIEGATLQALLWERGKLTLDEATEILAPVADALDYAHSTGVIHRDVKPGNIMIQPGGRPKVTDFGVAHLTSGPVTASGFAFGSPSYMAPEQVTIGEATHATDLFSLAIVAYETLTGHKPFPGVTVSGILHSIVNGEPQAPSQWDPAFAGHVDMVFKRALSKDPKERFKTASAFVSALTGRRSANSATVRVTGQPMVAPSAETLDLRATRKPWRTDRMRALAAAAAVAVVVAGGLWLRRGNAAPAVATAQVSIATDPPGAVVLVDGNVAGNSPLVVPRLPAGPHMVRVERPGFKPDERTVQVPKTGALPVSLQFALKAVPGTLTLDSDPRPAVVRIDGADVGTTPLRELSLDPGSHEARLERQGFEPWSETLSVGPGDTINRVVLLRALASRRPEPGAPGGSVRRGDLVELRPGVTPPLRLSGNPAPYPDAARSRKLHGVVTVELTVTEDGLPTDISVVESPGEPLGQALLAAVRNWRYQPAQKEGVQVKVRIRESQTF